MLLTFMALGLQVAAPAATERQTADNPIVVTGIRIKDRERRLESCRARGCPPPEEINATLALAADQFLLGDYPNARRTVMATRHRVARYAKEYPEQVSRLMLADSRLQAFDGRLATSRVSLIDALDAMRAGLPDDDSRLLIAELEIGEGYAREGRWQPAAELYGKIAKEAGQRSLTEIEANALFRRAVLYSVIASRNPPFEDSAARAVVAIDRRQEPAFEPYRQGTAALKVRLATMNKDMTPDEATAMLPRGITTAEPVLIYEPRTARRDILASADMPVGSAKGLNSAAPEWADFSYRIAKDGSVVDAEVSSMSAVKPGPWVPVALKVLQSQRYVPLNGSVPADGLERRVRYSIVRDIQSITTGTRLVQRSGTARLEINDLSQAMPNNSATSTNG